MKTDIKGRSTCPPGAERYERFTWGYQSYWQYDYRTPDGVLFSCVAQTLEAARAKRDEWLKAAERVP